MALQSHVSAQDLATCISCGLCLNDCPTYRVLGDEADSPRGRVQLIRVLTTSPDVPDPSLVGHLEACLVCRACETVCPAGVPFGRIMEGAREIIHERAKRGRVSRLLQRAGLATVANATLLRLATALTNVYVRSGLQRLVRAPGLLPGRLRSMESLLAGSEGPAYAPRAVPNADAAMFAGCVMRAAFGDTDRATVRLMERSGHVVTAPPDQVCCGALHAHAGDGDGARALARRNIDAFGDSGIPVVVNAAGCGAHLKGYEHLFHDEPEWLERARRFAARVRDVSEVVTPAAAASAAEVRPLRVVYQDACHLAHGQQIRRQPRALLKALAGVEIVAISDAERCCGSAGTYNLTHPGVAGELQRQKVDAILAAVPDVVVSANPGCMLQIAAGLRAAGSQVPVVHLARFLDDPSAVAAR